MNWLGYAASLLFAALFIRQLFVPREPPVLVRRVAQPIVVTTPPIPGTVGEWLASPLPWAVEVPDFTPYSGATLYNRAAAERLLRS